MPDAIYSRDGDLYRPSEWAGGPWSRAHQHGGPINGLLAHAVMQAAEEAGLRPIRITIDLLGPVPLEPLSLSWSFARRGKRMAMVDAVLRHADRAVARASAILVEEKPDLEPAWVQEDWPIPGPEALPIAAFMPEEFRSQLPPGFHWSLQLRLDPAQVGLAWLTTDLDLIEGEATPSLVRAAAVSDLTFAVAGLTQRGAGQETPGPGRMLLINTDTTLYFERPPEGAWFAFRHELLADQTGSGLAEVTQFDERGRYGRALQVLLRNPR